MFPKTCVTVFLGLPFAIMDRILPFRERLMCSVKYEVSCVVLCCVGFCMKYVTGSSCLRKRDLQYDDLWNE